MALSDDVVATCVTWGLKKGKWRDWTDEELNSAIQWVLEESDQLWIKTIEVKSRLLIKAGKNLGGAKTLCFAFVVSNKELTEEEAQEVADEYLGR